MVTCREVRIQALTTVAVQRDLPRWVKEPSMVPKNDRGRDVLCVVRNGGVEFAGPEVSDQTSKLRGSRGN